MRFNITLACAVAGVNAATSEQWRSRSIYQLLTDRFARTDGNTTAICNVSDGNYCGGTWRGIINHLDYIQSMGFTAIWISPVTENLPERTVYGYAYHGYWQQDIYKLNKNFGTAHDLKALSKALHERGMYLMVDVVTNHYGWKGSNSTVDYSRFQPFDEPKYFHDYCPISDYSNQTMVENCWLGDPNVELPDLRTEDHEVSGFYNRWISEFVSNYSIDGLRLDTVKHVGKPFWSTFNQAAGVFCTGEVLSGDPTYVCDYQNSLDSVLNYPLYYPIIDFLNSTNGTTVPLMNTLTTMNSNCKDISTLGTFSENHDLPRFASYTQDRSLAKNALALTLLWDGIPIVYAGQEQHYAGYGDPWNREATWLANYSRKSELYQLIAAINQVRNHALFVDPSYSIYNLHAIYNTTNTLALRKGREPNQIVSVYTNTGFSTPASTIMLNSTGWSAGTLVVETLTCDKLTVSSDGNLAVSMNDGAPRVYFAEEAARGGGICVMELDSKGGHGTIGNQVSLAVARAERGAQEREATVAMVEIVAAAGVF